MCSVEVVAKKGFVGIPRSRWGGINRHAVIWRDISCRKHFGYVFFGYVFFCYVFFCYVLVEIYVPIYYDDPEPLILEPNQQTLLNSTKPAQLNPTDRTHTDTTQPTLPNLPPTTHHPPTTPIPPTTQKVLSTFAFAPRPPPPPPPNPPRLPHLPPRRYYAPLPSPPDHHHHHHPTHPAYPTYHPEGTMHLWPSPPDHHHTTQPPTTTPPNHPPTHPFGTRACFITDVFVVLLINTNRVLWHTTRTHSCQGYLLLQTAVLIVKERKVGRIRNVSD